MSRDARQLRKSQRRLFAKAEALEECAGHLELDWTEDPVEREEGNKLVKGFMRQVDLLRAKAHDLGPNRAVPRGTTGKT